MMHPMTTAPRIAALSLPAIVGAAQLLLPAGRFDAPRGALFGAGPWHLSDTRGAALALALAGRRTPIPIDYEHQTLRAAQNGQPAPAAGWIDPAQIAFAPGVGLTAAAVRWTERAAAHIAAGEYLYLSPVFTYAADGAVEDLLHVALTNIPALDALPAVALAAASLLYMHEVPTVEPDELKERLIGLLNLPVTTTDAELLAQLDKLKAMLAAPADGAATAAASLPALIEGQQARIAALTAQVRTAPPQALVADLQRQVTELVASQTQRERDQLLIAALSDGRIQADSPLHTYAAGLPLAGLSDLLKGLLPIAALAATQTGGQPPAGAGVKDLTPAELAVCKNLGMTPDAYRAARSTGDAQ